VRRCEDLWFDDGSVILRAENLLFKVYGGILSTQSTIFKDLFTLPQPSDGGDEIYDGCPVVRLHDQANTMHHFLKILHDWNYMESSNIESQPAVLADIFILSMKYEVFSLRDRCLAFLSTHFPSSLQDLQKIHAHSSSALQSPWRTLSVQYTVANAARVTDALILLPISLLGCCAAPIEKIVHGTQINKRTSASPGPLLLEPVNRNAVLIARPKIALFARRNVFGFTFFIADVPGCRSSSQCREMRQQCAISAESEDGWINPFANDYIQWLEERLCLACLNKAKVENEKGRNELWTKLPGFFGLPDWDQLRTLSRVNAEEIA